SGCGVLKLREDRHEARRIRPLRLGHVAADLRNASSQREELRDDLREDESSAEPGREVGFEEFAPLLHRACIVIRERRQVSRHHGLERGGRETLCRSCGRRELDRKSTRLNSSHLVISYAVFCLKKKKTRIEHSQ